MDEERSRPGYLLLRWCDKVGIGFREPEQLSQWENPGRGCRSRLCVVTPFRQLLLILLGYIAVDARGLAGRFMGKFEEPDSLLWCSSSSRKVR